MQSQKKLRNKTIFLFFLFLLINIPTALANLHISNSVVKIFVTSNPMDYSKPWQSRGIHMSGGSGSIITGNQILTNAHVVSNQTFIQIKKHNDSKKYVAKLVAISHDADLALLEVADPTFFKGTKPIPFGKLPKLQDSVIVLGYPTGGDKISITEGVVSRVEVITYSQSARHLLGVQIDAAINPGNSGGPVLKDGKIIGVAMQHLRSGQNIGYMIPVPVIEHFFEDLKDEEYDGFPLLGIEYTNTENPSLRKYYSIENKNGGVLISRILPYSPADNILKEGDVLLKIDDIAIGEDGTYLYRNNERLSMTHLITSKQIRDSVAVTFIREGVIQDITIKLNKFNTLVPYPHYFKKPSYCIYGGLVFTVLSTDFLKSWGDRWWEKSPLDLAYYLAGTGSLNLSKKKV